MLLLSNAPALSTLGFLLATAGGLVGAFIALVKLRGDTNQSAVIQAQGANETMVELNRVLTDSLAACRAELRDLERRYAALEARFDNAVARWGPFPDEGGPS